MITIPDDLHEWNARKLQIRSQLYQCLGDLPPLFTPRPTITAVEQREGYRLEKFEFPNGLNHMVYGYILIPDQPNGAAVLYCHYHGGKYDLGKDELFQEPLFEIQIPRGIALVNAGYVVLAVDAYAFGQRQHQGAAGERESGRETEQALFKQFLWEGRSLWGMIVYDDLLALNYLLTRPEVDPSRIAVTGASMGGSRATWIGALDERVKVIAPVIQYTRYQNLIASGGLNRHSIYYYVPGVLKAGLDMEALVALAAPRPQIALLGAADPLSPLDGVQIIVDFTRAVYKVYAAETNFAPFLYPGIEHAYIPAMFEKLLDFFEKQL